MDTPGALHHVIGRGIDRTNLFRSRISGDSIQQLTGDLRHWLVAQFFDLCFVHAEVVGDFM